MSTPLIIIAFVIALAMLYVLLPVFINAFRTYRRKRVLRCPETGRLAEVDIDAPRAALSSLFGKQLLRVKNCTLWPRKKRCAEGCLWQWKWN